MGAMFEKMKRMGTAQELYEDPLVDALNKFGVPARRNPARSGKDNRALGDILFQIYGEDIGSMESQVAGKGHNNFSWGKSKVDLFVGRSQAATFSHLGCYDGKDTDEMIHMILPSSELHKFIRESLKPLKGKDGSEYYIIKPPSLMFMKPAIGQTIPEAVAEFVKRYLPPAPFSLT